MVADYIHLNPARAKLTGAKKGPLVDYPWSSLPHFSRGKGPDWLIRDRELSAFALAKNGRGRRAYVAYLEERAKTDRGKLVLRQECMMESKDESPDRSESRRLKGLQ